MSLFHRNSTKTEPLNSGWIWKITAVTAQTLSHIFGQGEARMPGIERASVLLVPKSKSHLQEHQGFASNKYAPTQWPDLLRKASIHGSAVVSRDSQARLWQAVLFADERFAYILQLSRSRTSEEDRLFWILGLGAVRLCLCQGHVFFQMNGPGRRNGVTAQCYVK